MGCVSEESAASVPIVERLFIIQKTTVCIFAAVRTTIVWIYIDQNNVDVRVVVERLLSSKCGEFCH
jgi:hypothetical protein